MIKMVKEERHPCWEGRKQSLSPGDSSKATAMVQVREESGLDILKVVSEKASLLDWLSKLEGWGQIHERPRTELSRHFSRWECWAMQRGCMSQIISFFLFFFFLTSFLLLLLFLFFLASLHGVWDLSFSTRDQISVSALEQAVWTTGPPEKP